ncbi:MAG: hypothetical protein FWH55_08980, partial [Oscillospiraceae bacterium]|nr:hypothetical protein [Oscillospiraceae bacterium]
PPRPPPPSKRMRGIPPHHSPVAMPIWFIGFCAFRRKAWPYVRKFIEDIPRRYSVRIFRKEIFPTRKFMVFLHKSHCIQPR